MDKIKVHVTCGEPVIELHKVLRVGPVRMKKKHCRYFVHMIDEPKRKVKFHTFEGCGIIQATNVIRNCRFALIEKLLQYHEIPKGCMSQFGDDDTLMLDMGLKQKESAAAGNHRDEVETMLNEIKDIYKAIIKRNELDDQLHKSKVADMQKAYGEINEAIKELDMEKNTLFSIIRETRDKRHQRFVAAENRLVDMVRSCQNIKREVENIAARARSKKQAVKETTELLPYQQSLNAAIVYLQNFLFEFGVPGYLCPDIEGRQWKLLKEADEAIAGLIREMKHMRLEEQSYRPHSAKSVVEMALRLMSEEKLDVKKIRNLAKGALNTLVYFRGSNDDPSVKIITWKICSQRRSKDA